MWKTRKMFTVTDPETNQAVAEDYVSLAEAEEKIQQLSKEAYTAIRDRTKFQRMLREIYTAIFRDQIHKKRGKPVVERV